MAGENEVVARFRADIEGFQAQLLALSGKVEGFDKKVDESNKKTEEGFKKSAAAAKNLGSQVGNNLTQQFEQLGRRIIAAFAVERVIAFGQEALKSFREAEAAANKLLFAVQNIAGGGIDLFKKLQAQAEQFQKISIFSDEQIQNAQTALLQFGLTGKQVEKLIPQILDLASAQGIDLAQATDKVIQGISGQTRGLKDAGIAFEDTGSKTENLAILSEKLAKFQGSTANALNTSAGAAKNLENRFDDLLEKVGEFIDKGIREFKEGVVTMFDFFTEGAGEATIQLANRKLIGFIETANKEILEEAAKADQARRLQMVVESNKRISVLQEEFKKANLQRQDQIIIQLQLEQKLNNDLRKIGQERQKIADDLTVKGQNKQQEAQKKALEDAAKREKEIQDQNLANLRAEIKANDDILKAEEEALEKRKKLEQEEADEIRKINEESAILTAKVLADERAKQEKAEEESRLKRIEFEERALEAVFSAYEEQANKRAELLQKETSDQEKAIETQRELAERGLANTLAFEERRLAELQRQQQREKDQARRVKLLETFLNSLAEFSKEDPKTALNKALLQVALATAASAVFAEEGGIIGDTANQRSRVFDRRHRSGKDVLLHAEVGEGIVPKKSMDILGKRNFELIRNLYRNRLSDSIMPELPRFTGATADAGMAAQEIVAKLDSLEKTVKNKKETAINFESYHNGLKMLLEQKENGNKTTTIKKLKRLG